MLFRSLQYSQTPNPKPQTPNPKPRFGEFVRSSRLEVSCIVNIVGSMRGESNWSDESKSWSPSKNPTESQFAFDMSVITSAKQAQNESSILDGQILQMLKDDDDCGQPPNSSRARRNARQKSTNTSNRSKAGSTSKDVKGKKSMSKSKNPLPIPKGPAGGYKMNTFESLSNRMSKTGPSDLLENLSISKFASTTRPDLNNTPDPKSKLLANQLNCDSIRNGSKQTEREKLMNSRHGPSGGFSTHKKSTISSAFSHKADVPLSRDGNSESDDSPIKQFTIEKEGGFLDNLASQEPNQFHNYYHKGTSADTSSSNNPTSEKLDIEVVGDHKASYLKVPNIPLQGLNQPFSSSSSINTLSKNSNKLSTKEKQPVRLQKVLGSNSGLDSHDSSPKATKIELPEYNPSVDTEKPHTKPLKKQASREGITASNKVYKPERPISSDKEIKSGMTLTKKASSKHGLEPAQPHTKRGSVNQQSNRHFPSIQEVLLAPQVSKD